MFTTTGTAVVEVDLIDMLNDVTQETKEQMYRSNNEFLMAREILLIIWRMQNGGNICRYGQL